MAGMRETAFGRVSVAQTVGEYSRWVVRNNPTRRIQCRGGEGGEKGRDGRKMATWRGGDDLLWIHVIANNNRAVEKPLKCNDNRWK